MRVRAFAAVQDMDEINRWAVARGLAPIERKHIPTHGLIVPGVAAGFVYRTDSNLVFLDGFISNPEAEKAHRVAALLHIGDALASGCQGKTVLVYTEHDGIARWCRESGLSPRGTHRLFSKEM